ncbi:armadillo repeat-containing protein 3-like [Syngnathus scovelli]|uniref:armadillo repeat-containing protein 3-like n=1 Tax=Syngnathus scovelli TaxID=161590 RepID=UPI00210FA7B0|nr:armadillo repeat-containing protein 3-like [Syngnathus scovelli]
MDKKDKKERKSKTSTVDCKETFEPLCVDVKTTKTAVLLLNSTEEDVVITACEAIFEFAAEDVNKVYLMELGVLQPLSQHITHINELIRRNAFKVLGTMASNSAVGNSLQQMDLIPQIIEKLSLDDVIIQEYGALCLSYLSLDPSCKVQIFDNKGLPVLIKLLSCAEPDIQKNSLETIYNLVQNSQFCLHVVELGGIPLILECLNSDYAIIQELALKILQKVTTDKESYSTMRKELAFDKLIEIIKNVDFKDLYVETLQVLFNCVSDSENFQIILEGGGLAIIFKLMVPPKLSETEKLEIPLPPVKWNNNEIQSSAVQCIARAAQNTENHKDLHDLNVEEILIEILSGDNDCAKAFVCQVMTGMSSFLSSKERVRELGGIAALLRLLSSGNVSVRREAVQALDHLTVGHEQNSMTLYEEKGHEILMHRLGDSCPKVVTVATAILCRIVDQESIRCDLLSLGAIPALVEPLKSTDSQVLINATMLICELVLDASARTEMQSAGGLEPLVNLLRSTNMEVLRSTCMAISLCAKDEPTSVEMCKYGALELLDEINQSDNRRSKFSEFALSSLMQSSMSLKYGLTDNLSSTDIITDGFYDAGKLRFDQKVVTLADLFMEPLNQHLPVVVVNTAVEVYLRTRNTEKGQPTERYWKVMNDSALRSLVKEVKESISPLKDKHKQYIELARKVSKVMGGAIEKEDLHTFGWLLHISLLKYKMHCNVIPIGMITKGFYCHRALLFKYLADCIGLSCSLVRGDYNRAWNEVLVCKRDEHSSQPCRYIVDLMHQPGTLLRAQTPAAFRYHSI